MFRHKTAAIDKSPSYQEGAGGVAGEVSTSATHLTSPLGKGGMTAAETTKSEASLNELMEKNLKWSQIIYEQNRKINNKLLWAAIASWVKLLILIGSIVAAVVFLPPLLKGVWSQYSGLFDSLSAGTGIKNPLDNVMKLFNLDPAQLEQMKTLLK